MFSFIVFEGPRCWARLYIIYELFPRLRPKSNKKAQVNRFYPINLRRRFVVVLRWCAYSITSVVSFFTLCAILPSLKSNITRPVKPSLISLPRNWIIFWSPTNKSIAYIFLLSSPCADIFYREFNPARNPLLYPP